MPTYVYRREDGSTFEVVQRITEDALEVCPETGQAVKRVISANTGLIFKGEGFYITDYARNGKKNDKAAADSSEPKSSDDSKPAESKPSGTDKKEKSTAKSKTE